MIINRGDIFYVDYLPTVGSEQRGGRPAVVVSNDMNNANSDCVEVVYFTTQPKADLPTHVVVRATGIKSTALCEQVQTISTDRLGDFKGKCTDKEMEAIDIALSISLGLKSKGKEEPQPAPSPVPIEQPNAGNRITKVPYGGKIYSLSVFDIAALMARLDVYKSLYNDTTTIGGQDK